MVPNAKTVVTKMRAVYSLLLSHLLNRPTLTIPGRDTAGIILAFPSGHQIYQSKVLQRMTWTAPLISSTTRKGIKNESSGQRSS